MKLQSGLKTDFVTDGSDAEDVSVKLENLYHEALNCSRNLKLLSSSPLLMPHNSTQRKVWFLASLQQVRCTVVVLYRVCFRYSFRVRRQLMRNMRSNDVICMHSCSPITLLCFNHLHYRRTGLYVFSVVPAH